MTEALVGTRTLAPPARTLALREVVEVVGPASPPVPRLRGVSHEKAFAFAPALGFLLVTSADGERATAAAALFAVTMTLMLGVSAVNHRIERPPRWEPWLRRLDHTTVNLALAGTWTAFALVLLSGAKGLAVTAIVWGGAIAASLVTILRVHVPGWIPATIAMTSGWSAIAVFPEIAAAAGAACLDLMVAGGLLYTLGGIVYALRRPNPIPALVGYHEIFHALVLAGAACHYAALAVYVLPLAS